jgi:tetratricopeptide (TPR) repeat protein
MSLTLIKGNFFGFQIFSRNHYGISLFYVNRNLFAGYMELVFCLSIGLVAAYKGGKRILLFGMTIIICLALLFSLSRGGIIGASSGLAFFLMAPAFIHRKKRRYRIGLSALFIGLIIIAWFGLNPVLERLSTLDDLPVAGEARMQIWQDTLSMIYARPFSGWGPGTFSLAFPAHQTQGFEQKIVNYAHNDYLELAADTGIFGLLVFIIGIMLLYISCLKKLTLAKSRYWQNIGTGALAACFAILIHSVTDCNLQVPANLFLFAIVAGIAVVAADNSRAGKNFLQTDISLTSPARKKLLFSGYCLIFCASVVLISLPFWGDRALRAATNSLQQQKYDEAITQVDQALLFHPDHAELLSLRGDILLTKKTQTDTLVDIKNCTGYQNIIHWYQKAGNVAPTNSSYLIKQGILFEQCQKTAHAKKAYSDALQRSPMYAVPYYHLALLHLKQQQPDDAVKYFRQFLKLTGTQEVKKVLDDIWSAGGDYETQKQAIPKSASFRQTFARYLVTDNEMKLAAQEAALAFSLDPTLQNAMIHLNVLWQAKDFTTALAEIENYLKQFPKERTMKERYAVTLAKLQHYQKAISVYHQLLDEYPENPEKSYLKIAQIYAQQKLYDKAVAVLEQGITKHPRAGTLFLNMGSYLRAINKSEDALSAFKKAASLNPDNASFRYQLGQEYLRHKLELEAMREWKACLTINSQYTLCKKGIEHIQNKFGLLSPVK